MTRATRSTPWGRALVLLCSAVVGGGCAHASGPADAGGHALPASTPLGVVGVRLADAPASTTEVSAPPSRAGGAGIGAAEAVIVTWAVGAQLGGGGVFLALIATPLTAIAGAIHGALETATPGETAVRVAAIERAVTAADPRRSLLNAILAARRDDRPELVGPDGEATGREGVRTWLEIDVVRIALEHAAPATPVEDLFGTGSRSTRPPPPTLAAAERARAPRQLRTEANPVLRLVVTARVRLLRVDDRTVLFVRDVEHLGSEATFNAWAADEARLVAVDLGHACSRLAARIVDEVL